MAAVNGTILGGSLDQNDAKNEIDNSHLQQSVLEAAHEPTESFVEREKNAASQNSYSVPQRRSQGSRRRYKERALKSFSSHKHKMTQFFQICADESRASFSEKQRLGVVYHKMLCKKALTSDDQRFFSKISKIFSPHRTQSVPSAVQAALPSVLELGAFAAGTDHFVADTPAPTTDTLLDTQNNAVHVAEVADENAAAGSVNDFAQDACNFACDFQPVENAENAENALHFIVAENVAENFQSVVRPDTLCLEDGVAIRESFETNVPFTYEVIEPPPPVWWRMWQPADIAPQLAENEENEESEENERQRAPENGGVRVRLEEVLMSTLEVARNANDHVQIQFAQRLLDHLHRSGLLQEDLFFFEGRIRSPRGLEDIRNPSFAPTSRENASLPPAVSSPSSPSHFNSP